MNEIFKYTLIALYGLGVIFEISKIGKKREPITKNDAICQLILNVILIIGILIYF